MAGVTGRLTVNYREILEVTTDPAAGAGTLAYTGSLALFGDATTGRMWLKVGAANTDWEEIGTGGGGNTYRTVVASGAILATDYILFVDTSGGAINLTLPDPTTLGGKEFQIYDSTGNFATNNLTLTPFAAESIEGLAAPKLLNTAWGGYTLTTNVVNWFLK